MQSFSVADLDPERFIERVRTEIASHGLEEVASIELDGNQIAVRISQFGTSLVVYTIEPAPTGFRARLTHETIAPMHRALLPVLEDKLNAVLERVGASLEAPPAP